MNIEDYRHIFQFFGGYLNEDSEDTLDEVVNCYKSEASTEERNALLNEIDSFIRGYENNLNEAFDATYGVFFDPELWGYTTTILFFDDLKRLLKK
jgi:hypothetical protein